MRVYVAYRTDSSRDLSEHLLDHVIWRYGAANVSATSSHLTEEQRDKALAQAAVILVVIGPQWLHLHQTTANDLTAHEVAVALRAHNMLVPVLVQGAGMPAGSMLRPDIVALSAKQGVRLRPDPDMPDDLDRIFSEVGTQLRWAPMSLGLIIGAAIAMLLQSGFLLAAGTRHVQAEVYPLFLLFAWVPVWLIVGVCLAFLRRNWAWGGALVVSCAMLLMPFFPLPVWINGPALYAFSLALLLFGLFGPRKEVQKVRRGGALKRAMR